MRIGRVGKIGRHKQKVAKCGEIDKYKVFISKHWATRQIKRLLFIIIKVLKIASCRPDH